jgi:hypothetical protein
MICWFPNLGVADLQIGYAFLWSPVATETPLPGFLRLEREPDRQNGNVVCGVESTRGDFQPAATFDEPRPMGALD